MNDQKINKNEIVIEENNKDKLNEIINYLRQEYFYCIWCGEKYENLEKLQTECPGNDSELHWIWFIKNVIYLNKYNNNIHKN